MPTVSSAATPAVARTGGIAAARETPAAANAGRSPSPAATIAPADSSAAASSAELPTVTITPLAHDDLGGSGYNGNVWAYNGFAYVGSWGYGSTCPAYGVRIVDITDPAHPQTVGAVAKIAGTTQEDVRVRHITTAAFSGDLLAAGIQRCGRTGQGGLALYDVSDPRNPLQLNFFPTGAARGVHELDLIQQGNRALALLAVPDSEREGGEGDFRIVDVSDPRHPLQLAQWGAGAQLGVDLSGGIGCQHAIFDHSARASADGRRVYLSYWDAGVIILDISEPAAPRLLGRIQYPPDEEGETHSVAEAAGGRDLLVADESGIFGPPPGLHVRVQTAAGPREVYGCEAYFSRPLAQTGTISADLVAVGSACPGAAPEQNPAGKVALADAGNCTPADQAARLAGAGAVAVILPQTGEPTALPGSKDPGVPVITIRAGDAADLRKTLGQGTAPVTLPSEKHSGGLRIWDIADLAHPRQLAVYQTPGSTAFPPPTDGFYTVHNPEVVGDLAYVSWYSDGLRVLYLGEPAHPRELASYVPPAGPNPLHAEFPDQTLDWGVFVQGDIVLLSDINTGLHIVRVDVRR